MNQIEIDRYYNIKDLIELTEFYFEFIDYMYEDAFTGDGNPCTRIEIMKSITSAKLEPQENLVVLGSHPSINASKDHMPSLKIKMKNGDKSFINPSKIRFEGELYQLLDGLSIIMSKKAESKVENELLNMATIERIEYLTKYRQNLKYNELNSTLFKTKVNEYVSNRLIDHEEILKIEQYNISDELKLIIKSYNQGIKINTKEKDLLTPLLEKDFELFKTNLERLLYIPSYFDIQKDEKERLYHIYLLGVLEGRLIFYNISSNREAGLGRYDIALTPINNLNPGIIIEIKRSNQLSNTSGGLNQIDSKKYDIDMISSGVKTIAHFSINFLDEGFELDYKVKQVD